jgi:hypothetical protein
MGDKTMKKAARLLIGVILALGLVSCGVVGKAISGRETLPEQSNFKQAYSIGAIVETHKDLLLEGPRTLSGTQAGPRVPFVQSQENMIIQVDQENATTLIESIRSDIEETLLSSGATIVGSGGYDGQADPLAYFSYSYREGPFYGVINIWGVQGEDTQFMLISEITESLNSGGN